jgi:hypothetical protein
MISRIVCQEEHRRPARFQHVLRQRLDRGEQIRNTNGVQCQTSTMTTTAAPSVTVPADRSMLSTLAIWLNSPKS